MGWLFILVPFILGIFLWKIRAQRISGLPPGPFQWPILGCLPYFPFHHRHRRFYELSKRFGPIFSLPIGSSNVFIVHGKQLAMEILRTRDSAFSSRPLSMTGKYIGFEHNDPNLCPLNDNWKIVRKAFSNDLMAPFRLNSQEQLRREEVMEMVKSLTSRGQGWFEVDMRKLIEGVVGSIIKRMLFGENYHPKNRSLQPEFIFEELEKNFEKYLTEGNFLWGELNMADYFPALGVFDLQGLEVRFKKLMSKLEPLFRSIIQEHRSHLVKVEDEHKDVIDILLQNKLSDNQIMGILSDALIPGISTTAAAIEWAMAELVANPATMLRAQKELDQVVGNSRLMSESDIPNLPYLQSICKEVLRLHPSAPLNDPHLNEEESTVGGYRIPPNSTILINLWALGQDSELWGENHSEFKPERFLGSDITVHGSHFELIPFSSGRRKCPAHVLAMLKMQHIVGVLVHGFNWKFHGAVSLEEGDGIVASPRVPLFLSAIARLECDSAYSL